MGQVTLEPMLFVKMVAEGNVVVIIDTLQLDRVCRVNFNYSEEDCMAMDDGNHSYIQVSQLRQKKKWQTLIR
jgi:MFS transporter, PCFT/HCP family, solute carrier family 46, member 3